MKLITTNINRKVELLYPELSYKLTGILFDTHNELGPYAREKQYGDKIEIRLKEQKIPYRRECRISVGGNIVDFIIDNKIILELKVKRIIMKEDYFQIQRYLQDTQLKLGLLVNFRDQYIKPRRIIKVELAKVITH